MPKFYWKGINIFGKSQSGYKYARDKRSLDFLLLQQEIALLSCKKIRTYKRAYMTNAQRGAIYEQLARLLDAGLLLPNALQAMADTISNVRVFDMLHALSDEITQGVSFFDAFSRYSLFAPGMLLHVLSAGEQSGKLSTACKAVASYCNKIDEIKKAIRSALMLPIITVSCFMFIVVFAVVAIIPRFSDLLHSFNQELPVITQWLVTISEWFTLKTGVFILGFFIMLYIGMLVMKKNQYFVGICDFLMIRFPLFGYLFQLSVYMHVFYALSLLLENGISLPGSLQIISASLYNRHLAAQLKLVEQSVKEGHLFHLSVQRHIPLCSKNMVISLLFVGETSGSLSKSCNAIANEFFIALYAQLSRLIKLIQPFCVIILGLLITSLLIALYAPIIGITFSQEL